MSDLEAALAPVREILARRDAARRRATAERAPEAAPAASYVNGAPSRSSVNWELFDQNLAEVRKVVERLRNGAH